MPDNTSEQNDNIATQLLIERERKALRWTTRLRIGCVGFVSVIIGFITGSVQEALVLYTLFAAFCGNQLIILNRLKKQSNVNTTGLWGALTDALTLCALPLIWHLVYTTDYEPLVHLSRHNFTAISVTLVALNGISLRPRYPAILTVTAVTLHVILAILALTDPRLRYFPDQLSGALGVGMSGLDLVFVTPLFVAFTGILITLAARAARATVQEAVQREFSEHQLREQHLQNVMDAKMVAVGNLVAGVEHEVNNPLGALQSAANTAEKAIARFRETQPTDQPDNPTAQRALKALEQSLTLTYQAGQRLAEVMKTIKGFVHLDRAEIQRTDLADLIQTILDVQKSTFRPDTKISLKLAENIIANIDPRRITEALTTVISNAGEAFDAPGTLTISLDKNEQTAHIQIQDTGRGMTPEQSNQLFEIDFAYGTRTRARFGLALCRSILHSHKGDIAIQSELGHGTTVTIQLPLTN